jgi:hypothetical protein
MTTGNAAVKAAISVIRNTRTCMLMVEAGPGVYILMLWRSLV